MVNTTYNSTQGVINKLEFLKGKTKIKFWKNINNYYDEINIRRQSKTFQLEKDLFRENVQGIRKTYHEVLLLMKFSQTKPSVKNRNFNYYDLYYTVIKKRDDNELVNDK